MAYERLVPGTVEWELYMGNHISRYQFAKEKLQVLQCKRVLDAATGVGYGANLLSTVANEIVGVDRDENALKIANQQYRNGRINFIKDDCETMELVGGSFDAIVSFETLEHLKRPDVFLNRCYALLNDGGSIIISTPNQLVSGHQSKKDWEYHEKEYTPEELFKIIESAGFTHIQLFGQYHSKTGRLKSELRSELNRIHSNPFMRMGKWIQKNFRGIKDRAILPESENDFEIHEFLLPDIDHRHANQSPFVLIAVAEK